MSILGSKITLKTVPGLRPTILDHQVGDLPSAAALARAAVEALVA